jgi:tRNA-2-methylthio-N6-dimethylallyladenosine synthase
LDWKREGKVVVTLGCVAQLEGDKLLKVGSDLVIGPRNYDGIEEIFRQLLKRRTIKRVYRDGGNTLLCTDLPLRRKIGPDKFTAFLTIQEGCDKVCTFCVVPLTRGREFSRPPEDILSEAKLLEVQGILELTLLGQNVDSYFSKGKDFADLLELLDRNTGFYRIRFTTSHPADINFKVVKVIENSERITRWFHLPLQAGSTKVLREMKRGYTKEEYIELAMMIRRTLPDAVISTDLMVGFPGETNSDFEDTLDVVDKVRFEHAYTFIYSPRPGTVAAKRRDQVSLEVAGRRLRVLIERVNSIIEERRSRLINKYSEILIEGPSKKDPGWSSGKNEGNITCVVPGNYPPGTILRVKIVELRGLTPVGKVDKILRESPLSYVVTKN